MTDFSLIGYESVGVQEYLPILLKIIKNLNFIYDFSETKGIIQISRLNDGSSCALIETENYDCNGHIKAEEILVPRESKEVSDESDEMFQVYTDHLQSKRDNLRKKNNEIMKLENTLEKTEEKYQKMEKKYKGVMKQLNETETELLECKQNLEKQKNINKTLSFQLKDKQRVDKEENEKYLKEIEELTKFYLAKLKDADEIATECVRLRKDGESGDKKAVKDRDREISIKDKSIKELNLKYENMEKKGGEMKEQLQKKQQALEVMKTKIKSLQSKTLNQSQEFNVLKQELSNKNEDISQLKIKITKYKDNLDRNEFQEIEMLKKEIIKVTDELKNLKQLKFNENRNLEVVTMVGSGWLTTPQEEPKITPFPNWWKRHMNK